MSSSTNDFNADELSPPSWLNDAIFAQMLRKCEANDVEVIDVKMSPATKKGDHYASVMFRAEISYKLCGEAAVKSKSVIVKTMPEEEGVKKDLLQDSYIFETEIGMYSEVLPRFERILRDIGDDTKLCVKCLQHSLEPHKYIIFEDIVPLGYEVLRSRQCDFEEASVTYTKLAKWQAISYKLALEEPHYFAKYSYSFMDMPDAESLDFITDGIKNFLALIKSQPEFEPYVGFFESIGGDLIKKTATSFREYRENRRDDGVYVLLHGDFHAKNVMMKRNERSGALEDVMLLDFQVCNMGSIAIDMQNGLFSMMMPDVREKHADQLLYIYHQTFVDTLQKIGYAGRVPSMRKLREEMFRHRMCELFTMTTFLPLWYTIVEPTFDPNALMESAEYRQSTYVTKGFLDELRKLLPQYLYRGYLVDSTEN